MRPRLHILHAWLLAAACLLPGLAQSQTPPQGTGTASSAAPAGANAQPPTAAAPATGELALGSGSPGMVQPVTNPYAPPKAVVFGSQMFTGRFAALNFTGFNPDYQLSVGDRVLVRMWGAITYDAAQNIDAQGNVFIPNVGPIQVLGVRNQDLNRQVEEQVRRTFKSNVGVYATLDSAQPVKVYVTGFVRAPGLYGGLSSDSVLAFLDKAGGIDPDRGSYLKVQILRQGKPRAELNLYDFLLLGKLERLQFQDGDTVVVQARRHAVTVTGEAQNAYVFEIEADAVPASTVTALALPKANATHLSVVRNTGVELKSEYHRLGELGAVRIQSGDVVTFTADKYTTTLLVRVEGAQMGERSLVLPAGATLGDLLSRLTPSPNANMAALQLFRRSVQARQRQTLEITLRNLETAALTARSATSEEAALRKVEADMMLSFVTRARSVQPLGQVVLSDPQEARKLILEDGDTINIPEKTNLVLVSGEVLFPNAIVFSERNGLDEYITQAGGYTQSADTSKRLVLRANGSVAAVGELPRPGDEIMILPKIDSKNLEVTRGITSIIYQIAVAAKVALSL
ncbi:polysaccharide biosynthesis/export family protein [Ideonella livida]|uniref:Polysialic acid transporter n=1 Tax=Ideonella livida TaxID=2707176 RepID=A0A7C9TJ42_9BURK|nr:polysaccharide biosynthesis/export family protein [Ideonella livida]NDY90902.1 polysialic acid transporter [Ideonella livida]